ncbi:MAG: hypothetical protein ACLR7U_10845 [Ruthenibacterium lactatiformans]
MTADLAGVARYRRDKSAVPGGSPSYSVIAAAERRCNTRRYFLDEATVTNFSSPEAHALNNDFPKRFI